MCAAAQVTGATGMGEDGAAAAVNVAHEATGAGAQPMHAAEQLNMSALLHLPAAACICSMFCSSAAAP